MPASPERRTTHRFRLLILFTSLCLLTLPFEGREAAAAKTRCTFSKKVLKVKLPSGASTKLSRTAAGKIKVKGCKFKKKKAPTVDNTRSIKIIGTAGNETATLNVNGGPFAGNKPIKISIRLRGGDDRVRAVGDAGMSLSDGELTIVDRATATLSGIEAASLIGGDGANLLYASAFSGPVSFTGGSGDDQFYAGPGNDDVDGGEGIDEVLAGPDDDLAINDSALNGSGVDSLASIETASLFGTSGNDAFDATKFSGAVIMTGAAGDDELFAGPGGAILSGGDGEDRLIGASGDDNLQGGTGDDSLGPGAGDDEVAGGGDTDFLEVFADVDLELDDVSLTGGLGTDALSSIERSFIVGGSSPNILDATGFTGRVTLAGLGGDDTLTGGSGDDAFVGDGFADLNGGVDGSDTIDGGAGEDLLYWETSGNMTLMDNFAVTDTTTDVLVDVESAEVRGSDGGDLFDISGWTKDATLDGGEGLNFLVDTGTGSRTLVDSPDDPEQAVLSRVTPPSEIRFSNIGIISLTGGPQPETIDAFDYSLTGVFIDGLGGDDLLIGGTLGDLLEGGDGDDELRGGDGDDTLTGGDGDDTFNCGAGTDDVTDYDPVDDIEFPDC